MTAPAFFAAIEIGPREEIRVCCLSSATTVDLRIFELFAGPAKVMTPSKRGISIPIDHVPAVIAALENSLRTVGVLQRELGAGR